MFTKLCKMIFLGGLREKEEKERERERKREKERERERKREKERERERKREKQRERERKREKERERERKREKERGKSRRFRVFCLETLRAATHMTVIRGVAGFLSQQRNGNFYFLKGLASAAPHMQMLNRRWSSDIKPKGHFIFFLVSLLSLSLSFSLFSSLSLSFSLFLSLSLFFSLFLSLSLSFSLFLSLFLFALCHGFRRCLLPGAQWAPCTCRDATEIGLKGARKKKCCICITSVHFQKPHLVFTSSDFHHVVTLSYLIIVKISSRNLYNLIYLRLQNFISPLSGQPSSSWIEGPVRAVKQIIHLFPRLSAKGSF